MSAGSRETPPRVARHVPELDGVRGLAVLVVIIHNSAWVAGSSRQLPVKVFTALTATGWVGVTLFFALSGFLITGILLDTRGARGYWRSFYVRRLLRIFPLYYVFLAAVVFIAAPLAWSPAWAAQVRAQQAWYWLYLSNWPEGFGIGIHGLTHLWSLAVEEQFYLLWPAVVFALGRRRLGLLSLLLVLSGPLIRSLLLARGLPMETTYTFTIARWDGLAAGALLAVVVREDQWRRWLPAMRGRVTVALGLALVGLVAKQHGFHEDDAPVALVGQSLVAGLSFCLLAYAIAEPSPGTRGVHRLLRSGGLRTLGKYSYAMYVFHAPLHHMLKVPLSPWVAGSDDPLRLVRVLAYLLLILGLSFAAALVSWHLLERPCLGLKERWG